MCVAGASNTSVAAVLQRALVVLHQRRKRQLAAEQVVPLPAAGVVRRDELRVGINREPERGLRRRGFRAERRSSAPPGAGVSARRRNGLRRWREPVAAGSDGPEMAEAPGPRRSASRLPNATHHAPIRRAASRLIISSTDRVSFWKPNRRLTRLNAYEQLTENRSVAGPSERHSSGARGVAWRLSGPRDGVRFCGRHEFRLLLVLRQDRAEDVPRPGSRAGAQAVGHDATACHAGEPADAEGICDSRRVAERVCHGA